MSSTTHTGNSPKTQPTTNLSWALKYARMGIRVFPLNPATKVPATRNGVKDATADEQQITLWWAKTPDAGIGLAPELKVGGPCFLEFDQKPSLKDWAKELGKPMPETRVHKSGGKGAPHFIFLHTELSVAIGNVNGSKDHQEWYSFRADNRYIVAPPSISPDTNQPYETWRDFDPTPIPDWVVYEISANGVSERQFAEGMREVDEDFDFGKFTDWIGVDIADEDGSWHAFRECPVAGRRHKQQGVRGCALYYDGSVLGFKCMAAECPSNIDRDGRQSGISFLVSYLSKQNGAYDGIIWMPTSDEEEATNFGAVMDAIVDATPGMTLVKVKQEGQTVQEKLAEIKRKSDAEMEVMGVDMNLMEEMRQLAEEGDSEPANDAIVLSQSPEPTKGTKEFLISEGTNAKEDIMRLYGILASDVTPEPLEWLWLDKIPAGKITLMAGQPDCGKTIAMLDIVARITRGDSFPDGSANSLGPRRVLLAATEDDLESTLVPRLMAAGAKLENVVLLKRMEIERAKGSKREKRILQLKADAAMLKHTLRSNPDIALVALDPISSYFGEADPNKDKEIRPVMEAVAEICDATKVAFLAIIHNNKRGDTDAIGKILGASSIVGVSRAVWGFAHDPDDKEQKYMTLVKGNLARNRKGMKYRITDAVLTIKGKGANLPKIEWLEETEATANDVLDMQRDTGGRKELKKIDQIRLLLQQQLDDAPGNAILLRDFYLLCEKEGLGDADKIKKTVQRACKDIPAVVKKQPHSKGPWWVMLDADAEPWLPKGDEQVEHDERGFVQPNAEVACF